MLLIEGKTNIRTTSLKTREKRLKKLEKMWQSLGTYRRVEIENFLRHAGHSYGSAILRTGRM